MSNLLNTKEAADKLGVSVRRIQFLITNEQLTAEKVGRDYIIRESDLLKLKKLKRGRRVGSKTKKPKPPETVKPDAPKKPEPQILLSIEAAAVKLKCSQAEIRKMLRNGLPTFQSDGRRRMIGEKSLLKFGKQNMIKRSDAEKVRVYGKVGRPKKAAE